METTTQLYWLTRLDAIQGIFGIISVILGIAILLCTIFFISELFDKYNDDDDLKKIKKMLRLFIVLMSISLPIAIFVPTKDDVIFIIAGGKTIDFVKSDSSINKIPSQTTKLISDYLNEQIKKQNK